MPRKARTRKKRKVFGKLRVVSRESYVALELDHRVATIQALTPLGLMPAYEMLDGEVQSLAGVRYERKRQVPDRRYGSNPIIQTRARCGLAGSGIGCAAPKASCG